MRAVAVSVWIFINLVFVGMCGYIYLLWSQYWQYVERQHSQMAGIISGNKNSYGGGGGGGQVLYYQGVPETEPTVAVYFHNNNNNDTKAARSVKTAPKHHLWSKHNKTSVYIIRRHNQPRFHKFSNNVADTDVADNNKPTSRCDSSAVGSPPECVSLTESPPDKVSARVATYKSQLVVQLRRVLLEESSVFKARGEGNNPYNVQYLGVRGTYLGKSVRDLVCQLKDKVDIRTLSSGDEPFAALGLGKLFPAESLLGRNGERYNSCAIVTNAGSLDASGLGKFIDSHDIVLRFNHAPTEGFEEDVGSKTSIRIVNSQVVTKPEFNFLESPLYHNVSLLAWDPSNYSASLEDWYRKPDFDVFTPYFKHRTQHPERLFHLLDPRSQWLLWEYIQSHIPVRIRKNPPSSGFLGSAGERNGRKRAIFGLPLVSFVNCGANYSLALLLPYCSYVDLFEYVPSVRLTKRCHYWDVAEDLSCTFGVWHPLAAEKLLALALNTVNDVVVFSDGYIRVPGYSSLRC